MLEKFRANVLKASTRLHAARSLVAVRTPFMFSIHQALFLSRLFVLMGYLVYTLALSFRGPRHGYQTVIVTNVFTSPFARLITSVFYLQSLKRELIFNMFLSSYVPYSSQTFGLKVVQLLFVPFRHLKSLRSFLSFLSIPVLILSRWVFVLTPY